MQLHTCCRWSSRGAVAARRPGLWRALQRCRAAGKDEDAPPEVPNQRTQLEAIIRRKHGQLGSVLTELGNEALEDRLKSAIQVPSNPPYRLTTLIAESGEKGRAVLVFEVARPSPATTPEELAKLAVQYVGVGADALVVPIDSEDTPEGTKDLFAVQRAVGRKVPVLSRDWIIHPLQVVEAKEAGAAGSLGIIAQVNGRGTAVLSSMAAHMGLDAPVEVVNLQELDGLAKAGVAFFGINLGVGISLAMPGLASKIAYGLLGQMPFGAVSMVGCRSLEEARSARASGADCLLIKRELLQGCKDPQELRRLCTELAYLTSGDD